MKVTATRPVWVESNGSKVMLGKGESADVDSRTYSSDHMFVAAGYLVAEQTQAKPKRTAKAEQTQGESQPEE